MSSFVKKFHYVFLIGILLLGFLLRVNNLYVWPREGATFDEYAWTWLGINLIQHHVPVSWSPHPEYTHTKMIIYRGASFRLVTPYLEHPPLFGIVAGSYALLTGTKDMYHVTIPGIRGLALLLGVFSILVVYLFSSEVYGVSIGLLAAFLYAIVPTVVIGSRLVQNENFFIPFFLLSLFFIQKYLTTNNKVLRTSAAIICGLLILAKIPWVAASMAIVGIFLYNKRYRDVFAFLVIVLPIFSLFFIYGVYFDRTLFFNLWQLQLHRYALTFNSVYALFINPLLVDRYYIDGWIYVGWFSIFLLSAGNIKKHYMILFPLLGYFLIFVAGVPNEPGHGWYRYPFYPFLIISTAVFLKEYFNKNPVLTFLFLMFTGLSLLQLSWAASLGFSFFVFRLAIIIFSLSLLPLFSSIKSRIFSLPTFFSLTIIFLLNIWAILNYNEQ